MFEIHFLPASNNVFAKSYEFTAESGMEVEVKVPPQAQHMIQLAHALSVEQPVFTVNDLIHFIDACCEYAGTTFTKSKGGTARIVRYYWPLLKRLKIVTETSAADDSSVDDEDAA